MSLPSARARGPRALARSALSSGVGVAAAMGVMNVAAYGFTILAARLLGPRTYGAVASLMGTLLVVTVVQLGIQATAARRIVADPQHTAQIARGVLRVTYRAAAVLGLLILALTPLIKGVLHLQSLGTAALVAAAAVPLTIMGGQAGILQGERRWALLSWLYVASGVPRLVFGTALILLRPNETMAMLGVAIGACVPVVLGLWFLRDERPTHGQSDEHRARHLLSEAAQNSTTLLAFFALSTIDIAVARNVLDQHDAGLYAAGLILTKAVLFLPQFVVVVAFPAMSTVQERRRALARGLGLIAMLGLASMLAAWLLPSAALAFVGGAEYAEIRPRLWLFATLGTALSMLQLLIYAVLARRGTRTSWLLWAAILCVVLLGRTADSPTDLLLIVIGADTFVLMALLALSWIVVRTSPDPDPSLGSAVVG